jgi:hypothetical protein
VRLRPGRRCESSTDDRVVAEQLRGALRRQIVLAEMHTGGVDASATIDAIVDDHRARRSN